MHKTRTDLFSRAPAHVQRQLHDLRLRLQRSEEDRQAKARRDRALRAAEEVESWEECKTLCVRLK